MICYRWTDAYKDASGFRFSTYFVSYLSEAMCLISGIGTVCVRRNDIDNLKKEKWNCNEVFNIPSESAVTHDSKNSLKSESSKCHENSNDVTLFWYVHFIFLLKGKGGLLFKDIYRNQHNL